MELSLGDICLMRKKHPCGGDRFKITRVGMDVKLRCLVCGREVMLSRRDAEKNIKKIIRNEDADA
jgi:conserved hypothetical protein